MPLLVALLLFCAAASAAAAPFAARRAVKAAPARSAAPQPVQLAGFRHEVGLRTQRAVETRRAQPVRRSDPSAAVRELSLQPAIFTPYDRYMGSVRRVIASVDGDRGSMLRACELMRRGNAFRYVMSDPYRAEPPEVTAASRAGDCKSKALWLLDSLGDASALYVIGKAHRRSPNSHAWVYWKWNGRWWILDPTNRANPIAADSVARDRYVPYYSFGKAGAFRHPATQIYLAGETRAIPAITAPGQSAKRLVRR